MATPIDPIAGPHNSKMLFLASHGLQTPISAIRWGCGRLKKMSQTMPEKERALIDGMHRQAKILSQMFDAMLLLAKVEDGVHVQRLQDVYLKDFLLHSARIDDMPADIDVHIDCAENARLRTDRIVFEAILLALLTVADTAGTGKRTVSIGVNVDEAKQLCEIVVRAPLEFSLVEPQAAAAGSRDDERRIVGGVPGLMLAVASSLVSATEGSLDVHEGADGVMRLRLPAPLSVSVLPEA